MLRILNLFSDFRGPCENLYCRFERFRTCETKKLEDTRQSTAVFNLWHNFFLCQGEDEANRAKIDRMQCASQPACAKSGWKDEAVFGKWASAPSSLSVWNGGAARYPQVPEVGQSPDSQAAVSATRSRNCAGPLVRRSFPGWCDRGAPKNGRGHDCGAIWRGPERRRTC